MRKQPARRSAKSQAVGEGDRQRCFEPLPVYQTQHAHECCNGVAPGANIELLIGGAAVLRPSLFADSHTSFPKLPPSRGFIRDGVLALLHSSRASGSLFEPPHIPFVALAFPHCGQRSPDTYQQHSCGLHRRKIAGAVSAQSCWITEQVAKKPQRSDE